MNFLPSFLILPLSTGLARHRDCRFARHAWDVRHFLGAGKTPADILATLLLFQMILSDCLREAEDETLSKGDFGCAPHGGARRRGFSGSLVITILSVSPPAA